MKESEKSGTGSVAARLGCFYRDAFVALHEYTGIRAIEAETERALFLKILGFLSGEIIENGLGDPRLMGEATQLSRFLDSLGGLRDSTRTST